MHRINVRPIREVHRETIDHLRNAFPTVVRGLPCQLCRSRAGRHLGHDRVVASARRSPRNRRCARRLGPSETRRSRPSPRLSECRIAGRDCTDIAFECERHQQACQPPVPPCDAGAPSRCPEADACNERLTACRIRGGDCTDIAFECERHQQACQPPVPPPRCPEAEACYERLSACRVRGGDCTDIAFECERHQQACQPPPDPAVNCREAIVSCSERYYHCTTVPGLDCDEVRKFCSDLAERCQQ
jgi:hypothetical protein